MSRYLIRRIEQSPAIELRTRTRNRRASTGHASRARALAGNQKTGEETTENIRHVFVMTGAVPARNGSPDVSRSTARGFIKTGPDLARGRSRGTPVGRLPAPPHLLETSLPRVFAVGDVRGGNIKRVASAVGEGSIAVSFVHGVLHE